MMDKIATDVLVVGSEGAGARVAIEAKNMGADALIVTEGVMGRCGATLTADMDIDVCSLHAKEMFDLPGDPKDTPLSFMNDMVTEGKFMNNQKIVWIHVNEAGPRVKELVDWGMKVEGLIRSPGHKFPRGIISTGRSMVEALKGEVKRLGIQIIEETMITDLLTDHGKIAGAVGLSIRDGEFRVFRSKAVVLATGGAMRVYPRTTAPEELTGDGIAQAYRIGAELVDMEFPMFLPACIVWPLGMLGVDLPYISSTVLHGWWLNKYGERFMAKWDPKRMEDTTRDVASIAQMMEILEGRGGPHGGIFVSYRHLSREMIDYSAQWQPWWRDYHYGNFDLKEYGFDLQDRGFEAAPASHYWNGGIRIDEKSATNIPGLYATGEIIGGNMGANRLSGNAVTECVVWGARAGKYATEYAKKIGSPEIDAKEVEQAQKRVNDPMERKEGAKPAELRERIQDLALTHVGPVRDGLGIEKALTEIEQMKAKDLPNIYVTAKDTVYNTEWVRALQVESMLQVLEIVARTSLMRRESRGAMYRRDYPRTDNKNWLRNIIVRQQDGKVKLSTKPVVITKIKPPSKTVVPYWVPG